MSQSKTEIAGRHDFDFMAGRWRVHHKRLKERLANSDEWIEFDGTQVARPLMEGSANVDDNYFDVPGAPYRGVTLRAFDPESGQWSIWWLDGRMPLGPLEPPMRGTFRDGVGTFYADETFKGIPIRVRFIWSHITPTSSRWEQAFSTDNGATWETNWISEFKRTHDQP